MNIWWEFRCDNNHRWIAYADEGYEPTSADIECPVDGTPAVTVSRQVPADRVKVALIPAARVIDAVVGTVGHDSEYFIEVSSPISPESLVSVRTFSWDDAIQKMAVFQKMSWEGAMMRWRRLGLDHE